MTHCKRLVYFLVSFSLVLGMYLYHIPKTLAADDCFAPGQFVVTPVDKPPFDKPPCCGFLSGWCGTTDDTSPPLMVWGICCDEDEGGCPSPPESVWPPNSDCGGRYFTQPRFFVEPSQSNQ